MVIEASLSTDLDASVGTKADTRTLLHNLLDGTEGVFGAVVARVDGRVYAQAFRHEHQTDAARIAAVSSSLLALSETFSREALKARTRYNSIVTDRGCIVTVRIPSATHGHVLCVWADDSENFATVLRVSLDAADKLALKMDGKV